MEKKKKKRRLNKSFIVSNGNKILGAYYFYLFLMNNPDKMDSSLQKPVAFAFVPMICFKV